MSPRFRALTLAAGLVSAAALSGCLTPHVKPPPSPAVLQARARAAAKPEACKPGGLADITPVDAEFAFEDAAITEIGERRLAKAAAWLNCNPGVEVVIASKADSHGDAAHQRSLAEARAKAVADRLRALGATNAVIRTLAPQTEDKIATPHLAINATGRGW